MSDISKHRSALFSLAQSVTSLHGAVKLISLENSNSALSENIEKNLEDSMAYINTFIEEMK